MKKFEIALKFGTTLEENDHCIPIEGEDVFVLVNFDDEFTKEMFVKSNIANNLLDIFYESKYHYGVTCINEEYCNKYDGLSTGLFNYINELKYVCNVLPSIASVNKVIIVHSNLFDSRSDTFKFDCMICTVEEILEELNKERNISIYSGNQSIDLKYSFNEGLKNCDIWSDILENNLLITNPQVELRIRKKENE